MDGNRWRWGGGAGAPWAASGRRTGVGVRSARARAPARRRRGNSRPCCRGPEAGRGEHTVAPPRGGRRRGGRRSGERPRGRTSTSVRAQPRAMRGGVCPSARRQHKQLQDLDRTANFDKTAVHLHGTEASPSRSLSQGRTAARPTKGAQGDQARVCALGYASRARDDPRGGSNNAQERRQAKTLSGERSSTSCGLRPQMSSTSRDPADFAHHRRRHPFSFTPQHAPKCSCMRLSTARLHFPCSPCARLRSPGSRCVHLLCYCTCLYCSNIVCLSLVLLYLLVLSCTCMP